MSNERKIFNGHWYRHYKHCTGRAWAKREAAYLRRNGFFARVTPAWEVWCRP